MSLFTGSILAQCRPAFDAIEELTEDAKIEAINAIRRVLHEISPFRSEPVDCVLWVKAEQVKTNDYNPNSVAPPEMALLAHSVREDGYTQPIVAWDDEKFYEVVDGAHRNRVGREYPDIRERVKGYLPITIVNQIRTDRGDRIAATIRHNRARGKHRIDAMSDIVVELKRRNWSDEKIGRELGMDPDEVLRLTQITGLAEMFADREFSKAWVAEESLEINPDDRLEVNEENLSALPGVGGLEGRDVPGDSIPDSSIGNRRGGAAAKDAGAAVGGDEKSGEGVAAGRGSKSVKSGKKSAGVARAGGVLPLPDDSGLPHETGLAHTNSKPAGRSKRRRRRDD